MTTLAVPYARPSDPERYMRKDRVPYRLLSFKGRKLDLKKPVQVYRNLRGEALYSIRQGGVVVAHADALMLRDAAFIVRQAGRERVLTSGRKNVHAWIRGYLTGSGCGTAHDGEALPIKIEYNPRRFKTFVDEQGDGVKGAMTVIIRKDGVTAAYVDWL